MKRAGIVTACAAILGVLVWMLPGESGQPDDVKKFMRPKLANAQSCLEGLALEDFRLIAKNATAMARLAEAAEWQILPDPEYIRYSSEFQRLCNELALSANKKNIDGATLKYVELTMNCVNCHKFVRDTRRTASVPGEDVDRKILSSGF